MLCDQWLELEKQYRISVYRYADAVQTLESDQEFYHSWRQVEAARASSERARTAVLRHAQEHKCAGIQPPAQAAIADHGTEDFLLGDQGQFGG